MKGLVAISVIGGVIIGALPQILAPKNPKIINIETFWKINGRYANDGETFEVFNPPLDKLP